MCDPLINTMGHTLVYEVPQQTVKSLVNIINF